MSSLASNAAVDFASIEEMDPSVADGFRVIYDREVPFELRLQESAEGPNDVGTLEAIKVCRPPLSAEGYCIGFGLFGFCRFRNCSFCCRSVVERNVLYLFVLSMFL